MTPNDKVVNYKILDRIIRYNFDIKFDFIRDHMEKLYFFVWNYVQGRAMLSPTPKNAFVRTGEAMTRPYKCHYF